MIDEKQSIEGYGAEDTGLKMPRFVVDFIILDAGWKEIIWFLLRNGIRCQECDRFGLFDE